MTSKDENPRRQPNRSKNAAHVDQQLESSKAAPAEGANTPEVPLTLEEVVKEAQEIADTLAQSPQVEFSRGQLGKAKRAFSKAGQSDASEEARKKWLA